MKKAHLITVVAFLVFAVSYLLPIAVFGSANSVEDLSVAPSSFNSSLSVPDGLEPRLPASKPKIIKVPEKGVYKDIVIVKLVEDSKVRLRGGIFVSLNPFLPFDFNTSLISLKNLLRRPEIKQVKRHFTRPESELDAEKERGERLSQKQLSDLNLYYEIHLISGVDPEPILTTLNALDIVEIAYLPPIPEPAILDLDENQPLNQNQIINPPVTSLMTAQITPTPNFQSQQGYLNNTDTGVHALYGWTQAGGTGTGIKIIDIEGGWQTTHEDFPTPFIPIDGTNSTDPIWRQHGTAVIGQMVAKNNGIGVTGIAYDAQWSAVSSLTYSVSDAINLASGKISPGDIILIELHALGPSSGLTCECNCEQFEYIPMEYWTANYDAIRTATANGRIVVEAGGNGSMNLDSPIYGGRFDRNIYDSGAILVGAGYSSNRNPHCWTNYGSRVDLQGWGDNVVTTGYGNLFDGGGNPDRYYTNSFSGTSSASPIVAGSTAAIQGRNKVISGGGVLSSLAMRSLLRNTGTAQGTGGNWGFKQIGPLPNIESAIQVILSGNLQVTLGPAGAVSAGAKWNVDGGAWQNSGTTVSGLSVGSHTVNYKSVTGWTAPPSEQVNINSGQTTAISRNYTQQTGNLQVTLGPAGAIDAGAQWRRVGTSTWWNSGDTESGIPVGQYTVEFKDIPGWNKPFNQDVTISNGQTTNASGTYTIMLPAGSLCVTISPQGAIDTGAQWRRVGTPSWWNSGYTESGIPVGQYTVEFKDIPGWSKPPNQDVTISDGQTTNASGTYGQLKIYVDVNATGANNGTSWTDAYTDLQSALSAASSGAEIWVARGTYKPTTGTDRTISFVMKEDVAIYGGFAGIETNRNQRKWVANQTTLSGDIGTQGDNSDNSYHVVVGSGAILDGFTITGGNADGIDYPYDRGGGMFNAATSPTLSNCSFKENQARDYGGGVYNEYSSNTVVTNCTFIGNAANNGGGMANYNSNVTVTNCTFSSNEGFSGGGMFNEDSYVNITNCILWEDFDPEIEYVGTPPTVNYSDIKGGYPGEGNIDADPMFAADGYHLMLCSPCIDAGTNTPASGLPAKDIDGEERITDGNCDVEPVVDMGVDEYYPADCDKVILFLKVDIDGDGVVTPKDGWQGWLFARNWTGPVNRMFDIGGLPWENPIAQLTVYRKNQSPPNAGESSNRSGGWAGVRGTGEYSPTGKGFGMNYVKLVVSQLAPATEYKLYLWSYEKREVWAASPSNPDSKYGVWSTTNPKQWLDNNGYDGGMEGEPPDGGYGPITQTVPPGPISDSNMPAGLAVLVEAEGGRASLMAPTNDNNDYLGGTNYRVSFWATTDADGAISIYGWIDPTDWTGSMHMPLNGFAIGVPEPECTLIADFTGDCAVDYEDLKTMADEWLDRGCCEADLYKDYKVDFKDFAILANSWLMEGLWP